MLTKLELSLVLLILVGLFVTGASYRNDRDVNDTANANEVVIQNFLFQPSTQTGQGGNKSHLDQSRRRTAHRNRY